MGDWQGTIQEILGKLADRWTWIGFIGQTVFFLRFVVQWWATERAKKVVIPVMFWYLSITGALITMFYSYHKRDPVFLVARSLGACIYLRNLIIALRGNRPETGPGA